MNDDDRKRRIAEALDLIANPGFMSDPDVAVDGLNKKGFFDEFAPKVNIEELLARAEDGDAEAKKEIRLTLLILKRRLIAMKAFW